MISALKKIGHFALGFAAGCAAVEYPLSALNGTLIFLGYQRLEQVRIKDEGFHETFQYGSGFVIGLLARLVWRWLHTPLRRG